jgi:hypothetical protein
VTGEEFSKIRDEASDIVRRRSGNACRFAVELDEIVVSEVLGSTELDEWPP